MFTKDMTVAQALEIHPSARNVFDRYNLVGCSHCHIASYETIEQICDGYSIPMDTFLETLNSLLEKP